MPGQASRLTAFRKKLADRLPRPSAGSAPAEGKNDAELWKDRYFSRNPQADTNGDGKLSWVELKAHRAEKEKGKKPAEKNGQK